MLIEPLRPEHEERWLAHYLSNELDADQIASFEAYALTRPHLLTRVDADTALYHAARAVWGRESHSSESSREGFRFEAPVPRNRPLFLRTAVSFVLGATIAGAFFSFRGSVLPSDVRFTRVVWEQNRGSAQAPRIVGPSNAALMLLDFAVPDGAEDVQLSIGQEQPFRLEVFEGYATALVSADRLVGASTGTLRYRMGTNAHEREIDLSAVRTQHQDAR